MIVQGNFQLYSKSTLFFLLPFFALLPCLLPSKSLAYPTPNCLDQIERSATDSTRFALTNFNIPATPPIKTHLEITNSPCDLDINACLTIEGGAQPYWLGFFTSPLANPINPQPIFHPDSSASIKGMLLNTDWTGPVKVNAGEPICGEAIPPGVYYLLIVDQNGSWLIERVMFESQGFDIQGEVFPTTCVGYDGAIDLTVFPENHHYFYQWSNGETTEDLHGLSPGMYTVYVYDQMDLCTAEATFEVPTSSKLPINLEFDLFGSEACVQAQGTPPYQISWISLDGHYINHGTVPGCIFDLEAGIYLVEVNDAKACSASEIFIIEPKPCRGGLTKIGAKEILSGEMTHFSLHDWSGEAMQWQFRTEFTEWLDIPGATQESYPTPPIQVGSDKEIWVRALVFCREGSVMPSQEARFFVYGDPNVAPWSKAANDQALFQKRDEAKELVNISTRISNGTVALEFQTDRSNRTHLYLIGLNGQVYEHRTLGKIMAGSTQHFKLHEFPVGWYIIAIESAGQVQNYHVLHQKL